MTLSLKSKRNKSMCVHVKSKVSFIFRGEIVLTDSFLKIFQDDAIFSVIKKGDIITRRGRKAKESYLRISSDMSDSLDKSLQNLFFKIKDKPLLESFSPMFKCQLSVFVDIDQLHTFSCLINKDYVRWVNSFGGDIFIDIYSNGDYMLFADGEVGKFFD